MILAGCFLSTRFNLLATVLSQRVDNTTAAPAGGYEYIQDPDSGAIVREWMDSDPDVASPVVTIVPCTIRGIVDGGVRVAGTTERFSEIYQNIDWAQMRYPAAYTITKRDRITNITDIDGNVLWREDEIDGRPTTFEVRGVTPVLEGFSGTITEYFALLERAELQTYA